MNLERIELADELLTRGLQAMRAAKLNEAESFFDLGLNVLSGDQSTIAYEQRIKILRWLIECLRPQDAGGNIARIVRRELRHFRPAPDQKSLAIGSLRIQAAVLESMDHWEAAYSAYVAVAGLQESAGVPADACFESWIWASRCAEEADLPDLAMTAMAHTQKYLLEISRSELLRRYWLLRGRHEAWWGDPDLADEWLAGAADVTSSEHSRIYLSLVIATREARGGDPDHAREFANDATGRAFEAGYVRPARLAQHQVERLLACR
jgi:hypothetical protein